MFEIFYQSSMREIGMQKKLNHFEKLQFLNDKTFSCTKKKLAKLMLWSFLSLEAP
jgi:hypothetical protein